MKFLYEFTHTSRTGEHKPHVSTRWRIFATSLGRLTPASRPCALVGLVCSRFGPNTSQCGAHNAVAHTDSVDNDYISIILSLCLVASVSAEPPVGDSYATALSGHHHDHGDLGRSSPSSTYGAPSARGFGPSQEYGAPSARNGLSQEYGAPSARGGLSTQYGAPDFRNGPSQEYGAPGQRSFGLSQEYGAPSSSFRNAPSQQYGAPFGRSSPSQSYGAPGLRSGSFGGSGHSGHAGGSKFGHGFSRNSISGFGGSFRNGPSQSYGAPNARSGLSQEYGAPNALDSYAQGFQARSPSQSYGAPSQRSSHSHGGLKTGALAHGFGGARSGLSQKYGAPSARSGLSQSYGAPGIESRSSGMPSEEYGVPDQYSALSDQGYGYGDSAARTAAALEELLNQEPANYDFNYKVNDYESGSDFGHTETRQENRAEGSYFVVLPDGTKQVVEYEADERGFKPRISVEPVGGYDDNAQDQGAARSAGGY